MELLTPIRLGIMLMKLLDSRDFGGPQMMSLELIKCIFGVEVILEQRLLPNLFELISHLMFI